MTRSPFECQPCNRQFASASALQSHLENSSRHFWCYTCNLAFGTEDALDSHLLTSDAHNWCSTCNRGFASQSALESHILTSKVHNWCSLCNCGFTSPGALESHLSTSDVHNWCSLCNRGFTSHGALESHLRNAVLHRYALANSRSPQIADAVPQKLSTPPLKSNTPLQQLSNAQQAPSTPPQTPNMAPKATNSCTKCNLTFKEPFQLREHEYAMHPTPKQRDIKCWGCPKTFRNYSTLLAHLETETCITTRVGLDKLAMSCPHWTDYVIPRCDAHLTRGIRARYIPEIVYKKDLHRLGCSSCERFFLTDEGLDTHIKSSVHHSLAYQCKGCESQHADLSGLLAHVEGSVCTEAVTYGTGSIGKLLRHLWQNLRE